MSTLLLSFVLAGLSIGPSLELGPPAAGFVRSCGADLEDTLHYDADPDRGASINGVNEYAGGVRHTAPETLLVKAILFYLTEPADMATVYVRDAGSSTQPGPVLDSFRTNSGGSLVWKRAELPAPRLVPAGRDFWTCVRVQHASGMHPLTLDLGPIVPERGGFIQIPMIGPTWYQLTDPPFWTDRNWNIRAIVEYTATGVEESAKDEVRSANWPTILRGRLCLAGVSGVGRKASSALLDATGRRVMELVPGENDLSQLVPGVYLIREQGVGGQGSNGASVRRVVVAK